MKKIFLALLTVSVLFGCSLKDEWGPVFGLGTGSGSGNTPEEFEPVHMTPNITIQDLCKTYITGYPDNMTGNYIIEGKVISTDQPGNFYKSFYIQDETAGIEIKIGKNSLYSDYHEGQTIYVKCNDLCLGMYGYKDGQGMVQIGAEDKSGKYETSYIESQLMIDQHIFRGEMGDPVEPVVVEESQLPSSGDCQKTNSFLGKLVTLKGLTYTDQVFVLMYPDSSRPHESTDAENRLFLSPDKKDPNNQKKIKISNKDNWKVFTWAMSKQNIIDHLKAGDWDKAEIGSGNTTIGPITNKVSATGLFKDCRKEDGSLKTYKELLIENAAGQSVSQYFKMGDTVIQLRTSGFCKFADVRIPDDVLDGSRKVNITGVLCMYQGSIQMVVNRLSDITYEDGSSLY
ncbi:MAG: DUF5689 domain-containing protein [Bacteroidales bacterium]|nr:DUF5689 domain-containing protein [Bacteroidales bacterium]